MSWFAYALLSAALVALASIFDKLGVKGMDSLLVTTIQYSITSAFLIGICVVFKRFTFTDVNSLMTQNGSFILFSSLITGLSWFFYLTALKHTTIIHVESIDRLSILFTLILSASLLGEPLEIKNLAGALLMVLGAVLIVIGL